MLDQLFKLAVKGFTIPFLGIDYDGMYLGESKPVLGSFFRLTFVENKGIAFGIELNPIVKVGVSLISVVASVFIVYYMKQIVEKNKGAAFGLALILAGAVGNMIDRVFYGALFGYAPLFYGHVVDFFHVVFDVNIFGYYIDSFPIFNIADVAVSLGVAVLFIFYGKEEHEVVGEEIPAGEVTESTKSDLDNVTDVETDIEGNTERPVRKISLPSETESEISEEPTDGKDNNRKDL
ncbi:MAG: signal peptidase II [Ignavibacteriales bacterium]|nr:signal peptidase II [Ignavibacteriales bacterium]